MKTFLTLCDDGPPFFFLGDPSQLTISLTYQHPGPTELDFSALSIADQKKVLAHLLAGKIESTVPFEDLRTEYEAIFSKSAPAEPGPKEPAEAPAKKPVGADTVPQIPKSYVDKEEKFQKECQDLVKKGIKAIKAKLTKANDPRMLRTIRDLEKAKKKPRVSVLNFVELELRKIDRTIIESIENDPNPGIMKADPLKQGFNGLVSEVEETDQETVQLTPDLFKGRDDE